VTVRILNERLKCTVWPGLAGQPDRFTGIQMGFPLVKAVDDQSEMSPTVMGVNWKIPVANQVKFLIPAQSKPRPGKIEIGSLHHRQLHHIAIKRDTDFDVLDVNGDVIELLGFH